MFVLSIFCHVLVWFNKHCDDDDDERPTRAIFLSLNFLVDPTTPA